jgi:hypothetical protein
MRILALLVLSVTGCSSVSILQEKQNAALAPAAQPAAVWVRPFEVPRAAEFDVSARAADRTESAEDRMGQFVAQGILSRADSMIAPGRLLAAEEKPSGGGLLVEGRILRARQGSRALRTGIGFGFGGTKFETSVRVYNLDRSASEPWLPFETTGGSNMEPGLIGILVPSPASIPIALTMVSGAATAGALGTKGISQDATRTGRMVALAIHDQLAEDGLIKRRGRVKRSGRLLTPAGDWLVLPES